MRRSTDLFEALFDKGLGTKRVDLGRSCCIELKKGALNHNRKLSAQPSRLNISSSQEYYFRRKRVNSTKASWSDLSVSSHQQKNRTAQASYCKLSAGKIKRIVMKQLQDENSGQIIAQPRDSFQEETKPKMTTQSIGEQFKQMLADMSELILRKPMQNKFWCYKPNTPPVIKCSIRKGNQEGAQLSQRLAREVKSGFQMDRFTAEMRIQSENEAAEKLFIVHTSTNRYFSLSADVSQSFNTLLRTVSGAFTEETKLSENLFFCGLNNRRTDLHFFWVKCPLSAKTRPQLIPLIHNFMVRQKAEQMIQQQLWIMDCHGRTSYISIPRLKTMHPSVLQQQPTIPTEEGLAQRLQKNGPLMKLTSLSGPIWSGK